MGIQTTLALPADYRAIRKVNLSKDKQINQWIQFCFVFITGLFIMLAFWLGFPLSSGMNAFFSFLITVVMVLIYMALHELTHAFFIKKFSDSRPSFAIRFPFLSVGSFAYFNRKNFLVIALAPGVSWGIVLIALLFVVPDPFFLSLYILLIVNFAGSSGDYVQAYLALRSPAETLFQDNGKETTLFLPADSKKDPGVK